MPFMPQYGNEGINPMEDPILAALMTFPPKVALDEVVAAQADATAATAIQLTLNLHELVALVDNMNAPDSNRTFHEAAVQLWKLLCDSSETMTGDDKETVANLLDMLAGAANEASDTAITSLEEAIAEVERLIVGAWETQAPTELVEQNVLSPDDLMEKIEKAAVQACQVADTPKVFNAIMEESSKASAAASCLLALCYQNSVDVADDGEDEVQKWLAQAKAILKLNSAVKGVELVKVAEGKVHRAIQEWGKEDLPSLTDTMESLANLDSVVVTRETTRLENYSHRMNLVATMAEAAFTTRVAEAELAVGENMFEPDMLLIIAAATSSLKENHSQAENQRAWALNATTTTE